MPDRGGKVCARCKQPFTGRRCPGCTRRRLDQLDAHTPPRVGPDPYADPAWRALSREKLRQDPLCECEVCQRRPFVFREQAVLVDHLDGLGPAGPLGLAWDNLRSMSRAHHNAKTNRHDGGLGNPIRRLRP